MLVRVPDSDIDHLLVPIAIKCDRRRREWVNTIDKSLNRRAAISFQFFALM
ncbi:hypothetical protein ABIB99_008594 [Bradyrhizobium sp. LA6.1]